MTAAIASRDWTTAPDREARNAEIIRRRRAGQGPGEIGRSMGLNKNIVAGVLHRAGLTEATPDRAALPPPAPPMRSGPACCWPIWGDGVRPGHPDYGRVCGAAPDTVGWPHVYCAEHRQRMRGERAPDGGRIATGGPWVRAERPARDGAPAPAAVAS